MSNQQKTNQNQRGGVKQMGPASVVNLAQRGPSNNRNGPGNQQQPARTTTTNKDFVLCLWNNDFPDCDNALVLDVWMKMVKGAQAAYGEDAVKKLTVFELNRVNLAIDRINGGDVGSVLIPMCSALFNKDGIFSKLEGVIEQDPGFNKAVKEDLKKVRDKHAFSFASTFMQAGLTRSLVHAMVRNRDIMKALRGINFKTYEDKACSCDKTRPGTTCNPCNHKNRWIEVQLNKLVPSVDPLGWTEDSVMTGMLVVQDFIKGLNERQLLEKDDKFYLDVEGLPEIDAPLERRMEHPAFLVNYENLVPGYQKVMSSSTANEAKKRKDMRDLMEKELEVKYKNMMDKTTLKGPNRYRLIIDMAKKAKRIIMFGGSSMTLLSRLMSEDCAHKIDFVGQGGTSDPTLNLTGNPFNWELNLGAAYDVLANLKHANGTARLRSFQLGTTELGKRVVFKGKDLADCFGHRFGRRVAAFGVQTVKTNPERANLRGNNYIQYLTKDGAPVAIMCPDLVALFAVFAEKKFRDTYCRLSPADKMFIVSKEGERRIDGKTVRGRSVVRVKFGTGSAEAGQHITIRDIIKPWDPRQKDQQFVATGHIDPIVQECVATFVAQVGDALGPRAPAVAPAPVARSELGGLNRGGSFPLATQPSQVAPRRVDSLPTETRPDQRSPRRVESFTRNTPSQDPMRSPTNIPRAQSSQGDRTANQVRRAEQAVANGGPGPSQGVDSGNRRRGPPAGQPGNGGPQRPSSRTASSGSGPREMSGPAGTANRARGRRPEA